MRLSEAILLGSVETKQGFGESSIYKESDAKCALGAALKAVGHECSDQGVYSIGKPYNTVIDLWPYASFLVEHPITRYKYTIIKIIWFLNDYNKWTRPQIAAWVAEQEVKLGIVEQVEEKVEEGDYVRG